MTLDLNAEFLKPRQANHQALTPISFLIRAAEVFPEKIAVVHGDIRITWRDYALRCRRLASALTKAGVGRGDMVAVLSPNTPAMLEAHFGVPMAGAVLNALNTRLDAASISYILEHCEAKVFLVDVELGSVARDALARLASPPLVIDIEDAHAVGGTRSGTTTYEDFLAGGNENDPVVWPEDEFDAISVNYTSGTTGRPKGVLFHHRGAHLVTLSQILHHSMADAPVYLWTLPMFHCNGWCFTWAVAAVAGTHVCLRKVAADPIFEAIAAHGVTHMCGAPTVLGFIIEAAARSGARLARPVAVMTAGAAPPAAVLMATEAIGFRVRHVYGMTEMHGVVALCDWHCEWDALPADRRARIMARQGVRTILCEAMTVVDPATFIPVPRDGSTMGEVMFRGNPGMKGYLKNKVATEEAFANGWYHTGDLAVVHDDGYIELKDRSKDIIISGGENISSIEIEDVLFQHKGVSFAAVIAIPDERWGEVPCAFIELKDESRGMVSDDAIFAFCRERLAKFKVPRRVIFGPIERTATGKVQKFKLRDLIRERENA